MKTLKILIYFFLRRKKWVEFCENNEISKIFSEKNFKILSQRANISKNQNIRIRQKR
jgi:hypothetical protein